MNAKSTQNKAGLITVIIIAIITAISGSYLAYNELNSRSEAGTGPVTISGHRPDPIIEGDDTSALVLGENFQEQCEAYIGETNLDTEFMNTESLEIQLPNSFSTDILEVRCPSGKETFRLNISTTLEELPE